MELDMEDTLGNSEETMNLLDLILIIIIIVLFVLHDRLWNKYLAEKEDRLMKMIDDLKRMANESYQNPGQAGQ